MDSVFFGAILAGTIIGAIPAANAAKKGKVGLAVGSFFSCIVGSLIAGLFLSVPICALFLYIIHKEQEEDTKPKPFCQECGRILDFDSTFCPNCGETVKSFSPVKSCPNCGNILEEGSHFCPNCGKSAESLSPVKSCPNCGNILEEGNRFCPNCGKSTESLIL